MRVYRIVGAGAYPVFDGAGAALRGGRWNGRGRPAIYAGASFAIAMLERLCYSALGEMPPGDRWANADVPDDGIETFDHERHPGWDDPSSPVARAFGDTWLNEARSLGLLVLSAITRLDCNLVINPRHPRFPEVAISEERSVSWDPRLFRR